MEGVRLDLIDNAGRTPQALLSTAGVQEGDGGGGCRSSKFPPKAEKALALIQELGHLPGPLRVYIAARDSLPPGACKTATEAQAGGGGNTDVVVKEFVDHAIELQSEGPVGSSERGCAARYVAMQQLPAGKLIMVERAAAVAANHDFLVETLLKTSPATFDDLCPRKPTQPALPLRPRVVAAPANTTSSAGGRSGSNGGGEGASEGRGGGVAGAIDAASAADTDAVDKDVLEPAPEPEPASTDFLTEKTCRNAFSLSSYEQVEDACKHIKPGTAKSAVAVEATEAAAHGQGGKAIFTKAAGFNHDCNPNCLFTVVGNYIFIRTTRKIKLGGECFISYTDITVPVQKRQASLQGRAFGFKCGCDRCSAEILSTKAVELSNATGDAHLSMAYSLIAAGNVAGAIDRLEAVRSECSADSPSSFGVRQSLILALQRLFSCYVELNRLADAYTIGAAVLSLFKPFRFNDHNYLDLLVKFNPEALLGNEGSRMMPNYLLELQELSGRLNGGGLSLLFEKHKDVFG